MTDKPVRIGLTNYLRFISATGLTRLRVVAEALQDYRDWKDYYRDLRQVMVLALKHHDPTRLERFLDKRPPDSRSTHFAVCAAGLIEWMSRTEYEFLGCPKSARCEAFTLRIAVNPEVALRIDGTEYLVKLYLAQGNLSQPAKKAFSWLVEETHGTDRKPALLEVRKQRLTPTPPPNGRVGIWVRNEAWAFLGYVNQNDDAA